jgi:hypothetical protein
MNNQLINNLMAKFFAVAIFACVISMGIVMAADESEAVPNTDAQEQSSYTENPGEIGDIARRAEAKIKEINEVSELEKEQLETIKREQYFEDNKEETTKSLLSNEDIAAIENKRVQNENAIRTKAGYHIESLAAEQPAAQEVSPTASLRSASQTSSRGMVKGIVFYEGKGAALITGDVIREGDEVLGVKITKITPDSVEFDKKGNQWKQQVGQFPPPAVWEQPQQSSPAPRSSTETKTKNKSSK